MKRVRYLIEAALARSLIFLFGRMSAAHASAVGGAILGFIGPKLSASRKAARHIEQSLNTPSDETRQIVHGMWENLGRVFAEYPHLPVLYRNHIELVGVKHVQSLIGTDMPAVFFSGHLANWELAGPSVKDLGIDIDLIYRAPNNMYVDGILQSCRSMDGSLRTYPKSSQGMRDVMSALKQGRRIGILIDQKYNRGVAADFFGRPAMTSTAFIQLAKRFGCPLIPARVERVDGINFRVTVYPPMDLSKDDETLLREAHDLLESWITERPAEPVATDQTVARL
ncbi:MAG TPA: lipid A biosynthesis acyltransferase, partial [Alphaproteobacteria bacterium]|nr:lipid A biosynthesis acyltransferase [Alphaproteobacteria bacterium]